MEFLSKIADYTIEPFVRLLGRQVGYVIHCKTNLQNLQAKVEELKAAREAIDNEVAEAKTKGEKIQPDVQLWLTTVGKITTKTDEFMKDASQVKLKCFHGFCPNLTTRHQLSRESTKLVQEAVEQYEKRGLISQVSCGILRKEVWSVTTGDYQALQSRMSVVKEIMDTLKDSDIQRMGVCGIGGVGKTTLVKEVYKQASEDKKLFDNVVIILDVKSNPDPEAIQKKIVEKLGMEISVNERETVDGRASRLCATIQGKKLLVILDDVQEKIDLEVVGLPRLPTCKILVTCRTRDVLSFDKMCADKVFSLDLLGKEESWNLFVKMAGDIVKPNGRIRDVAIKVAERCGGLPLLVVTVASALKGKNKLGEWKDALRRLKGFDKEELTEKAYLALEWSYNQLDDKELKPLFLLSGIIVQQNHIYVQDLLKYGVGLDLFTNVNTLEEARNALDTLLGKLKNSCLLLDSDTEGVVRMHDLVCHVANLIAKRDHQMLSIEYGGEFKDWPNKDFLKKCTRISLIHENIPTFPEIPMECPELELFYLHSTKYDESVQIPSNFFSKMQKLRVLNLTNMCVPSLPLSLQYLKKLQTLCLEDCELGDITLLGQLTSLEILSFSRSNLKHLPKEIRQLTCLRLLDLSDCYNLEVISPTVISSLVRLEDLRMRNSFKKWEVEGEGSNASLSELKHLSRLSALEIHIPNVDALPANLFSHKLERFNIFIGDAWDAWDARSPWEKQRNTMTLNTLKLKLTKKLDESLKWLLKNSEDLSLDETEVVIVHDLNAEDFENMIHLQLQNNVDFMAMVNNKVVFPNLTTLTVHGCDNLKFLFSFSMAKSLVQLTHLEISACKLLQEIVSSTREGCEENMYDMFFKLKVLKLEKLPNLARFSTGNYIEFPSLEELEVDDCDNLGVFIGDKVSMSSKDTRSCKEIEQRVLEEEENLEVKSETVVKYSLFNEKVGFPILERLFIKGIRELKAIWHVQLSQNSFWRLKEVKVAKCENLISLFPPSVMRRLNTLETLEIWNCKSLEVICEEIVGAGEEQEVEVVFTTRPQFVFPKVTSVELGNLPQLTGCINASQWPSLKRLWARCHKVGIFATDFSHFGKKYEMEPLMTSQKPLFLTDKDSFLNLEALMLNDMEIWNGPLPTDQLVFGKLKLISVEGNCALFSKQASVHFLQRLQNLEDIHLRFNSYELISGRTTGEEIHDDVVGSVALPRVRCLKLVGMEKLMHLGNDNSQSLFFPNLETLELWWCSRLKSIESSAISFRNLTTLRVWCCNGFEYITSYSVAKSLVQLKTLDVTDCESVAVIVASNVRDEDGDDAVGNEIVFSHLQHLNLHGLRRLQGFSSGNCTVKFPFSMILEVYFCPIKLKISSDGVLLTEIEHQYEQKGDDDEQKNDVETAQRTPLPEERAIQVPDETDAATVPHFKNDAVLGTLDVRSC